MENQVGSDPVKVDYRYVKRAIDPYRFPVSPDGSPAEAVSISDASVIEGLVDWFATDIEMQQIHPFEFVSAVIGAAALNGDVLTRPSSPEEFKGFIDQARPFLEDHQCQASPANIAI